MQTVTTAKDTPPHEALELCDETTSALIDGAEVLLSPDEFAILKLIKQANGAIVHIHQIRNAFENHRKSDVLLLNKTINDLKQKLGKSGKIIESILGIGYRLKIDVEYKPS